MAAPGWLREQGFEVRCRTAKSRLWVRKSLPDVSNDSVQVKRLHILMRELRVDRKLHVLRPTREPGGRFPACE